MEMVLSGAVIKSSLFSRNASKVVVSATKCASISELQIVLFSFEFTLYYFISMQ